jgi:hypothetical protein
MRWNNMARSSQLYLFAHNLEKWIKNKLKVCKTKEEIKLLNELLKKFF